MRNQIIFSQLFTITCIQLIYHKTYQHLLLIPPALQYPNPFDTSSHRSKIGSPNSPSCFGVPFPCKIQARDSKLSRKKSGNTSTGFHFLHRRRYLGIIFVVMLLRSDPFCNHLVANGVSQGEEVISFGGYVPVFDQCEVEMTIEQLKKTIRVAVGELFEFLNVLLNISLKSKHK